MLLPRILESIERNAAKLAREALAELREDPHTRYLKGREDEYLEERTTQLYEHLADWLTEKKEKRVASYFEDLAARGYERKVPLTQLVYALLHIKQNLWRYLAANMLADTVVEVLQLEELIVGIGRFFDTGTYHLVLEYERLLRGTDKRLL